MVKVSTRRKTRRTTRTKSTWRQRFAEAARYCAKNKGPGERIQDCIRRYLKGGRC
ncbi:MAG: hypothetical protein QW067_09310 [Thermofilaceae archaeon]